MHHLISLFLRPPPVPPISLPLPARAIPAIRLTIEKAFELAYYRGVYDGLLAGILIAMLIMALLKPNKG